MYKSSTSKALGIGNSMLSGLFGMPYSYHRSTCINLKILLAADRLSSLKPHCVSRTLPILPKMRTSAWNPCIKIVLKKLLFALDSSSRCALEPIVIASSFQLGANFCMLCSSFEKSENFVAPSASANRTY
jgi:hypothetical protein